MLYGRREAIASARQRLVVSRDQSSLEEPGVRPHARPHVPPTFWEVARLPVLDLPLNPAHKRRACRGRIENVHGAGLPRGPPRENGFPPAGADGRGKETTGLQRTCSASLPISPLLLSVVTTICCRWVRFPVLAGLSRRPALCNRPVRGAVMRCMMQWMRSITTARCRSDDGRAKAGSSMPPSWCTALWKRHGGVSALLQRLWMHP